MSDQNEKKRVVQNVLYITGFLAAVAGVYTINDPAIAAKLLFDNDIEMGRILGFVLIAIGLGDLYYAKTVFQVNDRK